MQLLLYVHNELTPIDQIGVRLHLLRCARCRAQVKRNQALSRVTADLIAPRQDHPWQPPASLRPSAIARAQIVIITLVLTTIIIGGTVAILHASKSTHHSQPLSHPCSPGLPNSNCQ